MGNERLRDDCFALPPGVDWTPVDDALDRLKSRLSPVVGIEKLAVAECSGRVLARPAIANRDNPAATNSAVDGYAFAYVSVSAAGANCRLELADGKSAAGNPYAAEVEPGVAVRVLTGGRLPSGTDTVVLDEAASVSGRHVEFMPPVKQGANARRRGEDFKDGELILKEGRVVLPQDLAAMSAAGIEFAEVRRRLRVGVLSTGSELRPVGSSMKPDQVYDANRPMLLSLIPRWGFEPVDLGCLGDERKPIRSALNDGSDRVDAMLTTGGASTGDEDHVSALLSTEGKLTFWRIAVKPGRPLAMALWNGVPIFGLPGNPVAAFVCALIFARPALRVMAGGEWHVPRGFLVPAAFDKDKKAGRREFLRARLNGDSEAEVFRSEGSGLTTGLSWSDGLVELEDGAARIRRGGRVRYLPYSSFGI